MPATTLGLYAALVGALALLLWRRWRNWAERRAYRAELAEREALLRFALWGSQAELWEADLSTGTLLRHNPLAHLAVTALGEHRLDRLRDWVHPEDVEAFRAALREHLRGRVDHFEVAYRTRDRAGGWVWMLTRGRVWARDASGRALKMVGTTFDISDIRASEAALRESEARLKLALWGSGDELWDIDLESGEIRRENAIAGTSLAPDLKFPRLDSYLEYVHPEDGPRLRESLSQHIRGLSPSFECAYRVRATTPGAWVWILGRGRVVERSAEGRALRLVGTNRDISAIKAIEAQLRDLNERLEARVAERTADLERSNAELAAALERLHEARDQLVEAEKLAALGSLVAGVAHEINTPLGVALTAASHLEQQSRQLHAGLEAGTVGKRSVAAYAETVEQGAGLVLRNLQRASELLRSFKQVAVDQSSEQRREIQVCAYLREILKSLGPRLRSSRVEVAVRGPEQLRVDTHPGALYQITANLVLNALLHAFDGETEGRLDIEVSADGERYRLEFADNGRGMDESVRRRIFEPFFTTRRGQGGSGLGLHIVYNLTTGLLGGSLRCESAPGQGARFILDLPRELPSLPGIPDARG